MSNKEVICSKDNPNQNPIGVTYETDKVVIVQGVNTIKLDFSMLEQLSKIREKM